MDQRYLSEILYVRLLTEQKAKVDEFRTKMGMTFAEAFRLIVADWINRTYPKNDNGNSSDATQEA